MSKGLVLVAALLATCVLASGIGLGAAAWYSSNQRDITVQVIYGPCQNTNLRIVVVAKDLTPLFAEVTHGRILPESEACQFNTEWHRVWRQDTYGVEMIDPSYGMVKPQFYPEWTSDAQLQVQGGVVYTTVPLGA
ncbi:hypothetical protein [Fodinicola acaciae]|uniref:hypothetical protein n=1 Tax=Fodinicola acaciae TaxID=2681555 RepID=UPI0013D68671|nr:hypothetical protein [Fodinicola acaciae]